MEYSLPFLTFSLTLLHPCADNFALQINEVIFINKTFFHLKNFLELAVCSLFLDIMHLNKWFLGSNCVHEVLMWSGVV